MISYILDMESRIGKETKRKRPRIVIDVAPEFLDQLDTAAQKLRLKRNELILQCLQEQISRQSLASKIDQIGERDWTFSIKNPAGQELSSFPSNLLRRFLDSDLELISTLINNRANT